MSRPASRFGDTCSCPSHGASVPQFPHVGRGLVRVNGRLAHVQGDYLICPKGGETIIHGVAATVRVGGRGAAMANLALTTTHKGMLAPGSSDVSIGGPVIVGDIARWGKACADTAGSRVALIQMNTPSGAKTPGYGSQQSTTKNCGCESIRQAIWELARDANGNPVRPNEYDLLKDLVDRHRITGPQKLPVPANYPPGHPTQDWSEVGETSDGNRQQILDDYKIENESVDATGDNIKSAIVDGNVVVTPVYRDFDPSKPKEKHVVLTIGIEYDQDGNPTAAYVNDTGVPNGCVRRVPWSVYQGGLETGRDANVIRPRPAVG